VDAAGDGAGDGAGARHPSRREFAARAVSALAAASALGASGLAACAAPRGGAAAAAPSPGGVAPSPDPAAKDSAGRAAAATRPADPVTEALFAAVEARYGARLEPEERAHVRDAVGRTVRLGDALRKRSVPNGVDPFSSFCRPLGGVGGGRGA